MENDLNGLELSKLDWKYTRDKLKGGPEGGRKGRQFRAPFFQGHQNYNFT